MKKGILLIIILLLLLNACVSVDKLLETRQFDKAIAYCAKGDASKQVNCYQELAEKFFALKAYDQAWQCYEKAGTPEAGAEKIAGALFDEKNLLQNHRLVYQYYEIAGMAGQGAEKIANALLTDNNLPQNHQLVFQYFEKAGKSEAGAKRIAEEFLKKYGDHTVSYDYFVKAGRAVEGAGFIADFMLNSDDPGKKPYFEDNPDVISEYYKKAGIEEEGTGRIVNKLLNKGKFTKALGYYEKSGKSIKIAGQIGQKLLEEKNYESAIRYFELAGRAEEVRKCKSTVFSALNKLGNGNIISKGIPVKGGLCMSDQNVVMIAEDGQIRVKNLISGDLAVPGKAKVPAPGHFRLINSDFDLLFTSADTWNRISLQEGNTEKILSGLTVPVSALTIDPDKIILFTGGWDGNVVRWDMETQKPVNIPAGHKGGITSLDYSGKGDFLASGSWDQTVRILDGKSQKEKHICNHGSPVNQVSVSPDGKFAVSCGKDNLVKMWSTESGKLVSTLTGHNTFVNCVVISPDNKWIITGDMDGTVKIWELQSRRLIRTFQGHDASVTNICVAPGSGYFVTNGLDFQTKLWWLQDKERFLTKYTR